MFAGGSGLNQDDSDSIQRTHKPPNDWKSCDSRAFDSTRSQLSTFLFSLLTKHKRRTYVSWCVCVHRFKVNSSCFGETWLPSLSLRLLKCSICNYLLKLNLSVRTGKKFDSSDFECQTGWKMLIYCDRSQSFVGFTVKQSEKEKTSRCEKMSCWFQRSD